MALVFVALLSVLIVGFMYEMEVSASLAANQGYDFEALLAAKSAVANGISLLADDQIETQMNGEPEYDSMLDASQWAMGLPFEPVNDAMMRTSISDEYGKINLNAVIQPNATGGAPQRNEALIMALHNFFALRSDSEGDPVDAIVDWLDFDDMDEEEPEGAENSYYMSLENPFACKNGPMDAIEELLLIKGVTPALYFGDPEQNQLPLSEYLTVNGDPNGAVNVNTAAEEVLAAMLGAQNGNADMTQAQMIYDEARTQPYEDLSRLSGFVSPAPGVTPGQGTGTTKPATPKPAAGGGTGRPGGLMQKSMDGPEKQLGAGSGFGSSGSGFGQSALTGTTKPIAGKPGTNKPGSAADLQQQQRQQQLSQVKQLFRVNSNVFRIYGDGMLDEVLVRIEAYVWRTPLDISTLENGPGGQTNQVPVIPGTTPGTKPGGGLGGVGGKPLTGGIMKAAAGAAATPGGAQTGGKVPGAAGTAQQGNTGNGSMQAMADAYGAPLVPAEPFRILDWKVIR
jgi:general secretion pathway protein K